MTHSITCQLIVGLMLSVFFAPDINAQQIPDADSGRYVEATLTGTFGEEITAPGVSAVLKLAKTTRAKTLVFVIDSPGGYVADARAIAEILENEGSDFRIITVIRRAISASIWLLSKSNVIAFEDGKAAGAAVAYSQDETTGEISVDSKFNSAIAAQLAGSAERRGQPGAVYRAMVVREVELFVLVTKTIAFD